MPQEQIKILLVEDDPSESNVLRELIRRPGPIRYKMESVDTLSEALKRLGQDDFDVILLDMTLPDINMVDTLIRRQDPGDRCPVVILSSAEDEKTAIKLVKKGAEDYLIKHEIDTRSLERSIHYSIERQHRHRAETSLWQAQAEIAVAREVQQALFPKESLNAAAFEMAGGTLPASPTGGDYFDFVRLPDGNIAALIADAQGHGLSAALVMAETRAYFRAFALNSSDIDEIANLVNRCLYRDAITSNFVTMLILRIDLAAGSLMYVNAGHPSGYIINKAGQLYAELPSLGLPLGISPTATYESAGPFQLEVGSLVVLVTDGVLEARNPSGAYFDPESLLDTIRGGTQRTAAELVADIQTAVREFSVGQPQRDDITLLVAKYREQARSVDEM
ncbi:MAG: PP2C family protein-serine/threonine phosphatase [Planctomycetota bacterium]